MSSSKSKQSSRTKGKGHLGSRFKVQCELCKAEFDSDYRLKHNKSVHGDLPGNRVITYKRVGAPANPFEAAKRKRSLPEATTGTIDPNAPSCSTSTDEPPMKEVCVRQAASNSTLFQSTVEEPREELPPDSQPSHPEAPTSDFEQTQEAPDSEQTHREASTTDSEQTQVTQSDARTTYSEQTRPRRPDTPTTSDAPETDSEDANIGLMELQEENDQHETHGLAIDLTEKFPNDPALELESGTMSEDLKRNLCSLGPCRPKESDMPHNEFPADGENRRFREDWYRKKLSDGSTLERDWLEYSPTKDRMYCFACRLFSNENDPFAEPNWTKIGLCQWRKGVTKIGDHEKTAIHLQAQTAWKIFAARGSVAEQYIEQQRIERKRQVEENREILKRLLDIVLFLGKQSLSLRGHREVEGENRGNFLELVELLAKYDPVLQRHLAKAKKNQTYLSNRIQNDFIGALARVVKDHIISRVQDAGCFSILMDETSDCAHEEQVSFILRYTYNGEIIESFLQFQNIAKTDALSLYWCLRSTLESLGLNLQQLRGQGYDGASNMSGRYSGLKTRVLKENPRAFYVHCNSHCLNLVLVDACKSTSEVRNFFGIVEKVYAFIEASPKRHSKFQEYQTKFTKTSYTLKRLVDTRWACHCDSLLVIKKTFPAIIATLEHITDTDKDATITATAYGLLQSVTTFEFAASLCILLDILQTIKVASDSLQTQGLALDNAFELIDDAQDSLKKKRSDNHYQQMLDEARKIAQECSLPETFQQKRVRRRKLLPGEEAPDEPQSTETTFKANVFLSCIDTCLVQLQERFLDNREVMSCFRVLTPKVLLEGGEELMAPEKLKTLIDVYGHTITVDVMSAEDVESTSEDPHLTTTTLKPDIDPDETKIQYLSWRTHVQRHRDEIFSDASEMDMYDLFKYMHETRLNLVMPYIYKLYAIFLTIPATTASSERSFSKLKIIKTYRRSSMGQERLSGLAILSIERQLAENVDFDEVIKVFANVKNRRMDLD